jgi:solute carrier family 25 (mitochondrial phosphate transporter), member 3
MKFASFEKFVEMIYQGLGKPKDHYNKLQQLGVSFVAGYAAGIFCAIVSQPSDNLFSKVGILLCHPPPPPFFFLWNLPMLTRTHAGDVQLNAVSKDGTKPTVGSIYKELGFFQLATNGLPVRIAMVGTLTALQWLIYDYVKVRTWFSSLSARVMCSD